MDIEEIRLKKRQLEKNMTNVLSALTNKFEKETGITPNAIYVSLVDTNEMGSGRSWVVRKVETSIEV